METKKTKLINFPQIKGYMRSFITSYVNFIASETGTKLHHTCPCYLLGELPTNALI